MHTTTLNGSRINHTSSAGHLIHQQHRPPFAAAPPNWSVHHALPSIVSMNPYPSRGAPPSYEQACRHLQQQSRVASQASTSSSSRATNSGGIAHANYYSDNMYHWPTRPWIQ
ncbi:unnamed protein product [Sphagnum balticum]